MKRVYDVPFLTHLEEAMDAELQDHEELLEITKDLSKDTSVKPEKREEFKNLHQRLKNSVNFCELLALKSALEEVLSPMQRWTQGDDLCVLELVLVVGGSLRTGDFSPGEGWRRVEGWDGCTTPSVRARLELVDGF